MVNTVGERIREARLAMKMSQEAFGALAGVTKKSQVNYELGARHPDTQYLTALAIAGVDVSYILLGNRKLAVQVGADELPVLDKYRHAKPDLQDAVKRLLGAPHEVQKALVTVIKTSTN